MSVLWMALLLALLGADLLASGIFENYAVDIGASVVCCVLATIAWLYHTVTRERQERQR